jgi:hypothetical protein
MKRILLALMLLALSSVVMVEAAPTLPPAQNVRGTVDGRPVTVSLRPYLPRHSRTTEAGCFQLVVTDAGGHIISQSSRNLLFNDRSAFIWGPAGEDELQFLGDLDGGAHQLVVSRPQSDVRAPTFRFFRWHNGHFELVREASVVERQGRFVYVQRESVGQGTWVNRFLSSSGGVITVAVQTYEGSRMQQKNVRLRAAQDGFSIVNR